MKRFFVAVGPQGAVDIRDREREATMVVYGYFDGQPDDAAEVYAEEIAAHLNRMTRKPFRWPWSRTSTAGEKS